jgi:hypothetical protein
MDKKCPLKNWYKGHLDVKTHKNNLTKDTGKFYRNIWLTMDTLGEDLTPLFVRHLICLHC